MSKWQTLIQLQEARQCKAKFEVNGCIVWGGHGGRDDDECRRERENQNLTPNVPNKLTPKMQIFKKCKFKKCNFLKNANLKNIKK